MQQPLVRSPGGAAARGGSGWRGGVAFRARLVATYSGGVGLGGVCARSVRTAGAEARSLTLLLAVTAGLSGFLAAARRPRLRFGLEFCHRLVGREDRHSMEVLQDEQIGITGNDGVDSGGMKAAKARGKHLGRPRTPARVITAVEELVRTTDLSVREIQRRIGAKTGRGVVGDIVKRIRHDSKLEAHAAREQLI